MLFDSHFGQNLVFQFTLRKSRGLEDRARVTVLAKESNKKSLGAGIGQTGWLGSHANRELHSAHQTRHSSRYQYDCTH
jgi:hypothetical protein